jgi:hypothetical protein
MLVGPLRDCSNYDFRLPVVEVETKVKKTETFPGCSDIVPDFQKRRVGLCGGGLCLISSLEIGTFSSMRGKYRKKLHNGNLLSAKFTCRERAHLRRPSWRRGSF